MNELHARLLSSLLGLSIATIPAPSSLMAQASAAPAARGDAREAPPVSDPQAASSSAPARVDLAVATLADLVRLPGIGETRARAILDARARRPFRRVTDLLRVPGIGRKTLARLAPYLTVGVERSSRRP